MSRYYSMALEVHEPKPDRIQAIKQAARSLFPFDLDDFDEKGRYLTALAEGNLCGGESEEQFSLRVAKAIWKATAAFAGSPWKPPAWIISHPRPSASDPMHMRYTKTESLIRKELSCPKP